MCKQHNLNYQEGPAEDVLSLVAEEIQPAPQNYAPALNGQC